MSTRLSPEEMSTKGALRQAGGHLREGGMLTFRSDGQMRSHLEAGIRAPRKGGREGEASMQVEVCEASLVWCCQGQQV